MMTVSPVGSPFAEPVFVDRRTQLRLFQDLLAGLAAGERRHVALLGLRRIGKTLLLDEVRARHQQDRTVCIVKLAVDTVVSTPESFALELASGVLHAALAARGNDRPVTTQPRSIATAAGLLGEEVTARTDELLELIDAPRGTYGPLLTKTLVYPAAVSDALALPMLVMLDEFQDIRRLQHFPGTETLWAALREALDRRGRVAFAVAGSIVTTMRTVLRAGTQPLFTRFDEVELPPFAPEDTTELAAATWERAGLAWDQNAVQRVHTLSQGFPFYAHTLARDAADLVRGTGPGTGNKAGGRVLGEHVDAAFQRQLLDRDRPLAIYLQYVLAQAIGAVRGENIPEAVLRSLAQHEGRRVADIARGVRRSVGQIRDVVLELIDIDVLRRDEDGAVWFVDPLLPVWLALERDRLEPLFTLADPGARARVIQLHQERLQAFQQAAGPLFEKRVHNLLRQFRGQRVSARLLGAGTMDGSITLPVVDDVRALDLPDPQGTFSGRRGSVEIDAAATGSETWLVECKHVRGAVTRADVERLQHKREFFERATGKHVDRLWIISQVGLRTEARERCEAGSVYYSGSRELDRLERALSRT